MISQVGVQVQDISYSPQSGFGITNGDFTLTETYTYNGENGLERFNECDVEHVERVIRSSKGVFRETPLLGVDLIQEVLGPLSGPLKTLLKQNIKLNVELGGKLKVSSVEITNDIKVVAQRVSE